MNGTIAHTPWVGLDPQQKTNPVASQRDRGVGVPYSHPFSTLEARHKAGPSSR